MRPDPFLFTRYTREASWLHWISAAMVLGMIPLGKILAAMPAGHQAVDLLRVHVAGGLAVLILTILRVVVAIRGPRPVADPRWPAFVARAARLVHIALYGALLVLAASGIATVIESGLGVTLLSGATDRWPVSSESMPAAVHGALANILIVLLVAHVLAAIYHQFWRRDNVFGRISLLREGSARKLSGTTSAQAPVDTS